MTRARGWRYRAVRAASVAVIIAAAAVLAWAIAGSASDLAKHEYSDFAHFYNAGLATRLGETIYPPTPDLPVPPYLPDGAGYIYPPTAAAGFALLAMLSAGTAAALWLAANSLALVTSLLLAARACLLDLDRPAGITPTLFVAALPVVLLADKLKKSLAYLGTDVLVLSLFAFALAAMRRAPVLAGVLLAGAATIKYTAAAFALYFVVRRCWAALAGFAGGLAMLALAPALVYGWDRNLGYWGVALGGVARLLGADVPRDQGAPIHELAWINSVSVPSAMMRIAATLGLPTGAALLATAFVAAGCVGIAWAIYRRRGLALWRPAGHPRALRPLEWAGVVVVALAFSPQTTTNHATQLAVAMLPAAVLLLPQRDGASTPRWPIVLGLTLAVTGLMLPPGGRQFEDAVHAWRFVGGATWLVLGMYGLVLWGGVRHLLSVESAKPAATLRTVNP
ncbi:MAG: glycosyltransferase family 87 protein [Planctomycetota bacterium]